LRPHTAALRIRSPRTSGATPGDVERPPAVIDVRPKARGAMNWPL
jgi:hypothetical protein